MLLNHRGRAIFSEMIRKASAECIVYCENLDEYAKIIMSDNTPYIQELHEIMGGNCDDKIWILK